MPFRNWFFWRPITNNYYITIFLACENKRLPVCFTEGYVQSNTNSTSINGYWFYRVQIYIPDIAMNIQWNPFCRLWIEMMLSFLFHFCTCIRFRFIKSSKNACNKLFDANSAVLKCKPINDIQIENIYFSGSRHRANKCNANASRYLGWKFYREYPYILNSSFLMECDAKIL